MSEQPQEWSTLKLVLPHHVQALQRQANETNKDVSVQVAFGRLLTFTPEEESDDEGPAVDTDIPELPIPRPTDTTKEKPFSKKRVRKAIKDINKVYRKVDDKLVDRKQKRSKQETVIKQNHDVLAMFHRINTTKVQRLLMNVSDNKDEIVAKIQRQGKREKLYVYKFEFPSVSSDEKSSRLDELGILVDELASTRAELQKYIDTIVPQLDTDTRKMIRRRAIIPESWLVSATALVNDMKIKATRLHINKHFNVKNTAREYEDVYDRVENMMHSMIHYCKWYVAYPETTSLFLYKCGVKTNFEDAFPDLDSVEDMIRYFFPVKETTSIIDDNDDDDELFGHDAYYASDRVPTTGAFITAMIQFENLIPMPYDENARDDTPFKTNSSIVGERVFYPMRRYMYAPVVQDEFLHFFESLDDKGCEVLLQLRGTASRNRLLDQCEIIARRILRYRFDDAYRFYMQQTDDDTTLTQTQQTLADAFTNAIEELRFSHLMAYRVVPTVEYAFHRGFTYTFDDGTPLHEQYDRDHRLSIDVLQKVITFLYAYLKEV